MTDQRLQELMDLGYTRLDAIKMMLQEDKESKASKRQAWTLQGNLRCPVCNKFSKSDLHTSGRGQNLVMRVTCDVHGVYIKLGTGYWKAQSK